MKNLWRIKLCILLSYLFLIPVAGKVYAQVKIGMPSGPPDASAQLELSSTAKGFLLPRLSTTQRNAIAAPAKGLMIFNTTTNLTEFNAGTAVAPSWITGGAATVVTLYSGNGSLTGNRTVTQNANTLSFSGAGSLNKFSGNAGTNSTFSVGRAAAEFDMGTAGLANAGLSGTTIGDDWLRAISSNLFLGTKANKYMVVKTNDTERMRITASGQIGVAEASPVSLFSNSATTVYASNATGAATDAISWLGKSSGFAQVLANASQTASANGLAIKIAGSAASNIALDISRGPANNTPGAPLLQLTGTGKLNLGAYGSGTFRGWPVALLGIDANGNVLEIGNLPGINQFQQMEAQLDSLQQKIGTLERQIQILQQAQKNK